MFSDFFLLARDYVKDMTLDEKIGQLLLVRYSNTYNQAIKNYHVGGFVFFEKDFQNKTKTQVKEMINQTQSISKTPLITATDEEGGTVVRVSSNPSLRTSKFSSPQELYTSGGFEKIKEDTIEKATLLGELGINVNLAPVVDVSTNPDDYMYNRTLGKDTTLTAKFAKTVIEASKKTPVSFVLKHFPGYGNNSDTHAGAVTDNRPLEDIEDNDLPPFKSGIESGAEAVLVSHNIVTSIDADNPASLSSSIHNILRNNLDFTGVIITDDLAMHALDSIPNKVEKAILSGNDILIVTDYETSFNEIKDAVENGRISESKLDEINLRIIAWKYSKGLMYTITK